MKNAELSQYSQTLDRLNLAGCDAVEQDDNVDDDDSHSSCSTVYTVGDISQIIEDQT